MPKRGSHPERIARKNGCAAFSLVELLVVVAVIGVLLAIALPALRGARVAAGRTQMLSNLHGVAASFEAYTTSHGGVYPFHDRSKWLTIAPLGEGGSSLFNDDPWLLKHYWHAKFHAIAPWREHYMSWLNRGVDVDPVAPWSARPGSLFVGYVSYHYSCSFMARPEAWATPSGPANGSSDSLIAPTRTHEVASPSAKALMIDADRAYLGREERPDDLRGVLMADGSASSRADAAATAPVQNKVNDRPPAVYHDTPGGVRGRDVP